jgi:hypothetical protein
MDRRAIRHPADSVARDTNEGASEAGVKPRRPGRRRLRPGRHGLGKHAIAIAFLGMMIVVAPPTGAPRTAALMAGTSLLENAPAEVRSEVEINGSPEAVWQVLADLAHYPVWNPFLYPVEGELRSGSHLQVTMHVGTQATTYQAMVVQVEPNRVLSWSGQILSSGVFDTTYSFSIEPVREGRVRLVSRETRKGLAPLVEWMLKSDIQGGLDAMTRSARNRVELLQPASGSWWPPTTYSRR